jgi:hypothetical protein
LKGGTAINFFIRDLPRLSVDIDLAFIPINERDEALKSIKTSMDTIATKILKIFPHGKIVKKMIGDTDNLRGMVVSVEGITVKIEPNIVMRGTVYEPEEMELSQSAQNMFEMYVAVNSLSFAELYASKICAALDRQHPRDLFDIHLLLSNEGIDGRMRKAFIVYLISHPRPMVELLNPNFKNVVDIFENEFRGMTKNEILIEDLLKARDSLVSTIKDSITDNEKAFLLSLKKGKPDWSLLGLKQVETLPAVQWKLKNIQRMDHKKHIKTIAKLEKYLEQ